MNVEGDQATETITFVKITCKLYNLLCYICYSVSLGHSQASYFCDMYN